MLAFQMNMPMWEKREGRGDHVRGSNELVEAFFCEVAEQCVSQQLQSAIFYVPDWKGFLTASLA